jgi:hypothetical protein
MVAEPTVVGEADEEASDDQRVYRLEAVSHPVDGWPCGADEST